MNAFNLHLMRHGAPEGAGRLLGHSDAPPTPEGNAACIARAAGIAFDEVICSDLSRAHAPAKAIAEACGMSLHVDPRWRELNFGEWDGNWANQVDPACIAAFWDDPDNNPPPEGERWSDLESRVEAALAQISGNMLVVTHAGAIRAALSLLLGLDHRRVWCFDLPYAALVSLRIWTDAPRSVQITGLMT